MDIFENLENLNVSEECFDDILNLIEEKRFENYKLIKEPSVKKFLNKSNKYDDFAYYPDEETFKKEQGKEKLKALKDKVQKKKVADIIENLDVSEECFDDIMDIVEELLNEDELHDTKAIRRKAEKNSKILNKEIKANNKELGKAQHDNMIAGGDAQSLVATARWSRKERGNQDEGTKNLCSNANQAVKKAIKTSQKVQDLHNKDTDLTLKKMNQDDKARKAREKVNQLANN